MIFPCVKHANTKIQKHKYTNTAYNEVPETPNMWHIFEKKIIQGYQKLYSDVSNTQVHKYKYTNTKYTNTQIQFWSKLKIGPTCDRFLKR